MLSSEDWCGNIVISIDETFDDLVMLLLCEALCYCHQLLKASLDQVQHPESPCQIIHLANKQYIFQNLSS